MKVLLMVLLAFVFSCTTVTVEKKANTTVSGLDERLKEKAKSMNVAVRGILESDLKSGQCQPSASKVKAKWNWSEAVNAANYCLKVKDFNTVESLANELAIHDTSTPWGPYFMARVAFERGQLDRALWMVELSLKRAPEFGVTHYLKGQILWARKEYKEGTGSFERAIGYDDGIGPAHLILGQVYLRDQDYSKAAPQFERALNLLPDNLIALNGQAESQLKLNNPNGALDAFVRLSELDSADGRYLSQIGALYEGPLNNPDRALNAYKKLHDLVKSGRVKKNIDPDNDSKIREIQEAFQKTAEKGRSVASEKKEGGK